MEFGITTVHNKVDHGDIQLIIELTDRKTNKLLWASVGPMRQGCVHAIFDDPNILYIPEWYFQMELPPEDDSDMASGPWERWIKDAHQTNQNFKDVMFVLSKLVWGPHIPQAHQGRVRRRVG